MLNEMSLELEKVFNCKFEVKESDGIIEVICSDKYITKNEETLDKVLDIASKYLEEDRLWDIGLVYDYLNEIPSVECELEKAINIEKTINISRSKRDIRNIIYNDKLCLEIEKEIILAEKMRKQANKGIVSKLTYMLKPKVNNIVNAILQKNINNECYMDFNYNIIKDSL